MAERNAGGGQALVSEREKAAAVLALLSGALIWGVIWYPYRLLRDAGIDGAWASTICYSLAFLIGLVLFRRGLRGVPLRWGVVALALSAGGCNLAYVLAALRGEIVRVLLLFYLAPLWTVLLSRSLLGEQLNRFGVFVISLSLCGAVTILWHPAVGWPTPRDNADWFGLGAGFSFALFNVLSRYAQNITIEAKSMVAFAGVVIVGLALLLAGIGTAAIPSEPAALFQIGLIGAILLVVNLVVQYGLGQVAANRAIVIMLTEVGFAALASWWLAGESFGLRESIGGAMIIAASMFSAKMEAERCV